MKKMSMHYTNVDINSFIFHTFFIPDPVMEKDGQSTNFENVDELGKWHNARLSYCIESKLKKKDSQILFTWDTM